MKTRRRRSGDQSGCVSDFGPNVIRRGDVPSAPTAKMFESPAEMAISSSLDAPGVAVVGLEPFRVDEGQAVRTSAAATTNARPRPS